ncbi:hypothetical protein GGG87_05060 [Streptococcus sp. zg-86]|uniref:Uncharacterized protein n=1 Tax=Streptococcus zhangguiae TaxID=2664091 RepID=A0A6I4RIL1_9STRE|nr:MULTISPECIES: hypothetical protein [unclassified Streptococcus]MTB64364.1 hypothetical protein [Streptococcus sp. zg-86]MTB90674.1 hypothetical protein [Streptococcus sp. zg-36]MWV56331.1 hypothetical protein [Streptococcus sp. zg-70]QTH47457.1 hypothetical protein J5M87_07825 [Streptococcus sp. zg-86]
MSHSYSLFIKKHTAHLIGLGFFVWIAPVLMLFTPKVVRAPFFATADWHTVTIVWLVPIIGVLALLCSLYLKRKKYLFFSAFLIFAQPISYLLWFASFYLFFWGYGVFYWLSNLFH